MILQLKITLKGYKPPIWRRIQVDSDIRFDELHVYIQAAFDWEDSHLHQFFLKGENQRTLVAYNPDNISIGLSEAFGGIADFSEKDIVVGDMLTEEKDKALYIYDFGADWEHEILLEKILPAAEHEVYPICVKARRHAPEENAFDPEASIEDISDKALLEDVNRALEDYQSPASPEAVDEFEVDWKNLFELVDEFKALKPWEHYADTQLMMVELPEYDMTAYCTVLGNAGEEFGLAVYLGQQGLENILETFENPESYARSGILKQHSLLMSFANRDELDPADYDLIQSAGKTYRGKNAWPMFRNLTPGYYPWFFEAKDVAILSKVLEQALKIYQNKDTMMVPQYQNEKWLKWAYKAGEYKVAYEAPTFIEETKQTAYPLQISELDIQRAIKQHKKLNSPIEFAMNLMPEPSQNEAGERPFFPRLVTAIDHQNGQVLWSEIFSPDEFETHLQAHYLKMIEAIGRVPREVWMNNQEMIWMLDPVLSKLKTKVMAVEKLTATEDFVQHMLDSLGL